MKAEKSDTSHMTMNDFKKLKEFRKQQQMRRDEEIDLGVSIACYIGFVIGFVK